jgi:hypothetical protein
MSPQRLQRKRSKGWRKPAGAIYVGRPTRWGNRWQAGDGVVDTPKQAVRAFEMACQRSRLDDPVWFEHWLKPLRGHDLLCWCPPGTPCHGDVLLRLANEDRK